MPFIPSYAFRATWRETPGGGHLLVCTITDEEDKRSTTLMCPSSSSWVDLMAAWIHLLDDYGNEHLV